jgi:predicted Ser/Thr protein kinase
LKFGRYEVLNELGKGAMGLVYLGRDPMIGRLVALKTIRVPSGDDDDAREFYARFLREAQAAGILSHPSIVTVHDIGQDIESEMSYIAMEYIDGPNLKEILQRGDPLPPEEAAEIIAQVAEALDYAHQKGIVHRDVKPANILRYGTARVKITDFGIAKIASAVANLTTTGQFLGTPNYMAPEQIKGTDVDGRSDLFSLGIVLYEALTRKKPFAGDSLTTISYKIVHETFPPLREVRPELPPQFDAILEKVLAKNPADRFQDGRQLAAQLRSVYARHDAHLVSASQSEQTLSIAAPAPTADAAAAGQAGTAGATPSKPPAPPLPATVRARTGAAGLPPWREMLRRPVPAPLFFGVPALLLLLLIGSGLAIRSQHAAPVDPDQEWIASVSRERELRISALERFHANDIDGAYLRFRELQRLRPESPYVQRMLPRLEQLRNEQLTAQQRREQATVLFAEGQDHYRRNDFVKAVDYFERAQGLDDRSEIASFLHLSREQLKLAEARRRDTAQSGTSAGTPAGLAASTGGGAPQTAGPPAGLTTTFDSTVADGHVLVRVGGEILLHENVWEERRGMLRRKIPRKINITREISSGPQQIEVWVVVPSLGISERRLLNSTLQPGGSHSLNVTLDASTRRVMVVLS